MLRVHGFPLTAGSHTQRQIAGDLALPIFNSCQAEKQPGRKDAYRKPLLPKLPGN